MTQQLSRRSSKYVWLCLPSFLSLILAGAWVISIAPDSQRLTREETEWRNEQQATKNRQEYLRENSIEPPAELYKLAGFVIGQSDPKAIPEMYFPGGYDHFGKDQTVQLLDEYQGCIGFISARKLYLEDDNPGLCGGTPSETNDKLENATHI